MAERKTPARGGSKSGGGKANAPGSGPAKSGETAPPRARSTRKADAHPACEEAVGEVGGVALIDGFGFASKPVVWAEVDGQAIVEGDILIGTAEEARAKDVSKLTEDPEGVPRGVGIDGSQFRWPSKNIPFEIDAGLTNPSRVTNAIAHWEAKTPFTFVPRTNETSWMRFVGGGGCSSWVGRQGGGQEITLGANCTVGNTIHEIGHALGLWHEQSREDRNSHVKINFPNIQAGKEHNFNQHINDGIDLGGYGFGSIMHYGPTAFAKSPGLITIESLAPLPPDIVMGQRDGLSAGDIAAVKLMYPNIGWAPKTIIKDVAKEPFREPGKIYVKERIKDLAKDPLREPVKSPPDDLGPTIREVGGPTIREVVQPGPGPIINPALPFVLGRGSDFVSRYQELVAQQSGLTSDTADATAAAAARALALAEVVTALDQVRETLAAIADDLANEAGV